MKRVIALFWGLMLMAGVAEAKPVNADMARRVAETWMHAQGMANTSAMTDITSQTQFTEFYVFVVPENGFVLVSADDCVQPILGYSLTNHFKTKDIPEHVIEWLRGYEEEIRWWKNSTQMRKQCNLWDLLESGIAPEPLLQTSISPFVATTWNQSPYYNKYCPYDNNYSSRTVTGCTATAMAQVMKYYNYPIVGYGSNSYVAANSYSNYGTLYANFDTAYQWNRMPNALTALSNQAQINAVANLMYHVGVATEMKYGVSSQNGSGAYLYSWDGTIRPSAQVALMQYFKYSSDMYAITRVDYTGVEYSNLLRQELDQNRPILYQASYTESGHSVVLDGYNNFGLFHVNWGWGGHYDGYYVVGTLNPGISGTAYYHRDIALLGIRPNICWDTIDSTVINVNSNGNGTVSGDGNYSFRDTVTITAKANDGYRFSGWSDGSKFNPRQFIANGGNYSFSANFVPVTGDTLHYCPGDNMVSSYGISNSTGATKWGMALRSSLLPSDKALLAVQLYVKYAGDYDLTVYTGSEPNPMVVSTTSVTFYDGDINQWKTIILDTPVSTTDDLWIMFSSTASYPATYTYGTGVAESFLWWDSRVMHGHDWNITAMIKCIFGNDSLPSGPTQYTVNINRVCINCNGEVPASFVIGEGSYTPDTTVLIEGLEEGNWRFDYWIIESGDTIFENPYIIYDINSNRNITAVYSDRTGILDAAAHQIISILPNPANGTMTVSGLKVGSRLEILDMAGRKCMEMEMLRDTFTQANISDLPAGVYFVRVSDGTETAVRKLIVK